MISKVLLASRKLSPCGRRSIRLSAVRFDDAIEDPIKKIFLQKLQEYKEKSKDGKMFEPTPEIEKELKEELARLNRKYGGDGTTDMTQFPEFKFPDVKIDPISIEEKKTDES